MSQFCAKAEKGEKSLSPHLTALLLHPPYPPAPPECFYNNKAVIPSFRWHHLVYWVGVAQRSSAAAVEATWSTVGWFWCHRLQAPGLRPPSWSACRLRQFPERLERQQLMQVSLEYAKQQNQTDCGKTPGKTMAANLDDGGGRGEVAGGNRGSLLQYICSNYRSIWRRKLNLDCSMLCRAPCGSVVKRSNHGKHGRARSEGRTRTQSQTDSNRVHYSTVQYCRGECEMRLQHWCITSGKSWQISLVKLNVLEPVGWQTCRRPE